MASTGTVKIQLIQLSLALEQAINSTKTNSKVFRLLFAFVSRQNVHSLRKYSSPVTCILASCLASTSLAAGIHASSSLV